jgi:hypothetical protein
MALLIEDGHGSGSKMAVTKGAASVTTMSAIAKATLRGDAYAWNSVSADINTTDILISVRNLSQDRLLVVNRIYAWVDVPAQLTIHITTSATAYATGTAVVGVNLNTSSAKVADAGAYTDDDGVSQGSIIATLHTNEATADIFPIDFPTNDCIILGTNGIISVDCIGELAAFEATIIGYYIDA